MPLATPSSPLTAGGLFRSRRKDLCNSFKGTNLSGIDPKTETIVKLFHPRRHKWVRHFRWKGATLRGTTSLGRATIAVLRINLEHRVLHRQALIDEGVFPL